MNCCKMDRAKDGSIISLSMFGLSLMLCHCIQTGHLKADLKKAIELRETERKGRINAEKKLKDHVYQARDDLGYNFRSIGYVESIYVNRRGTPRQPILVTSGKGRIIFEKHLIQHEHFKELSEFSHIWVLFVFHDNTNADKEGGSLLPSQPKKNDRKIKNERGRKSIPAKVAPPRLHGSKVGCLSTRSPHRPNPIGLSVCAVDEVTKDYIVVSGLDMIDGTPVLDIKPYIPYDIIPSTLPIPMASDEVGNPLSNKFLEVPSWIYEYDIPSRKIVYSTDALKELEFLMNVQKKCPKKSFYSIVYSDVEDTMRLITQVLRQDIRSVHQGRKSADSTNRVASPKEDTNEVIETNSLTNLVPPYEVNIGKLHIVFYTYESHILVKSITTVV